jgi:hypothetical protein
VVAARVDPASDGGVRRAEAEPWADGTKVAVVRVEETKKPVCDLAVRQAIGDQARDGGGATTTRLWCRPVARGLRSGVAPAGEFRGLWLPRVSSLLHDRRDLGIGHEALPALLVEKISRNRSKSTTCVVASSIAISLGNASRGEVTAAQGRDRDDAECCVARNRAVRLARSVRCSLSSGAATRSPTMLATARRGKAGVANLRSSCLPPNSRLCDRDAPLRGTKEVSSSTDAAQSDRAERDPDA